ncbi:MAG: hypothetical protein PVF18_09615 [Anaerolineales bacterium]
MQSMTPEASSRRIRRLCPYCDTPVFDMTYRDYLGGRLQEASCTRCHTVLRKSVASLTVKLIAEAGIQVGGSPARI